MPRVSPRGWGRSDAIPRGPNETFVGGTSFEELQCRASCPFCKETGLRIVYLSQRVAFVLTKTILFRLRFYFLFPNEIAFS